MIVSIMETHPPPSSVEYAFHHPFGPPVRRLGTTSHRRWIVTIVLVVGFVLPYVARSAAALVWGWGWLTDYYFDGHVMAILDVLLFNLIPCAVLAQAALRYYGPARIYWYAGAFGYAALFILHATFNLHSSAFIGMHLIYAPTVVGLAAAGIGALVGLAAESRKNRKKD
jgi:hypothetical protein